jgi:alkyl sulfatase BDS1-like metallo-beta-lactamase superfamily hydrolase
LYYSDVLRSFYYISIAVGVFLCVMLFWMLSMDKPRPVEVGVGAEEFSVRPAPSRLRQEELIKARMQLFREDPRLVNAVAHGGGFGGEYSIPVATDIFGTSEAAVQDVRSKTKAVEITEKVWLIRFPIVNAVLVETQVGLVLIDSGYRAASEVLLEKIRELSDKSLHTVIYTHGHVDHAFGLESLIAAGERPEIIAHKNLPLRFKRYIRTRGAIAKYMGQPLSSLPTRDEDLVYPTRLMDDRLELLIGGERFIVQHHRGETDDQVYVWIPDRGVLASADYYQSFLPNAGNGKRVQRYPEEWAKAMREMASLEPTHLAPGHGEEVINDPARIQREFLLLAEALESIVNQTINMLNQGLRKDQVTARVALPPALREERTLREQYVSAQDISRMVISRYTGWWNDVPSDWTPARLEDQAVEIARLAGGANVLAQRARMLMDEDIRLASHLVDWAWLADPAHPEVQSALIDVYRARILDRRTNTMEMVNYLKAMVEAKAYQLRN